MNFNKDALIQVYLGFSKRNEKRTLTDRMRKITVHAT